MTLQRIVTGGQTGVDRGALDAALQSDFPCGGWCPPSRLAEDGVIPAHYPLTELAHGNYRQRTIQNVLDSDATVVIYFGHLEGGTEQTVLHCIRRQKPYKLLDAVEIAPLRGSALVAQFVEARGVATLNIAGPRRSKAPEAEVYTFKLVTSLIEVCRTGYAQQGAPADGLASASLRQDRR